MNIDSSCESARMTFMASLDGEGVSAPHEQHVATCSSCRQWLNDLQSMAGRLQSLSYPEVPVDLWPAVEGRIRRLEGDTSLLRRLWLLGVLVLAWRSFQLFVDLPIPLLHPLVPLAALVVSLWLVSHDPLAIETSVPELEKRGI